MKQYLNKQVVATFQQDVGFPDGTLGHMVQGVITEHHPDEHWIIINGILVNYQNNPLMSICLSAAEAYGRQRPYKLKSGYLAAHKEESASVVIEAEFEGVEYSIEFDGKGNIGGLVKIGEERKGWDFYFNEEAKA